jgi:transposase
MSSLPNAASKTPINRHKQHRGFATRYDKLAVRYDATVQITNINIWLRDSSNRA